MTSVGLTIAYLCIDAVYEPLRRWGSKTGGLRVWGIWVDGRKVLLTLSTAHSESYESCLEVWRDLLKRGLQTPVTMTTDGAPGLIQAMAAMWPRSLRMRCWFHKMQHLHQKVPPQAWPACKALIADMRDAPTFEAGQRRQQALLAQYHETFPRRAGVWRTMPRPVSITCRCPHGIVSMCARRTWRNGPLKRNGVGPKSFRISGTRPVA